VDKNNNIISEQFEELIKNSKSRILQETTGRSRTRSETNHFNPNGKQSTFSNAKRVKGGSVSNLFSSQMKGLISELEGTNCNFVRCIKPNQLMTPGYIDRSFVVEQLRCSGTVQACEVLRVGLPTRILYAEVVDTYKSFLSIEILQMFDNNEKLFTQAILWAYSFPSTAYRLGDTRLFFKTGKIDLLDQLLTPSTYVNPEDLSKLMLKYLRKRKWINGATKAIAFQKFHSIYSYCKFRRRATIIQCMIRQALARKKVGKLRRLHRTHALWTKLAHKSTVMSAFQELPQDKMILLDRLLRARYIPQRQMWLLKWLGPLQRVIYLQKLWKRLISQFSAKQGFLRLYHFVKEKRSAFILQNHVRIFLARIKFQQLRKAKIARMRWRHTYIKVKILIFRYLINNNIISCR
jgi:myosin heavy subunit